MALPVLPSFFHSRRSLRASLKPPPAPCATSPAPPSSHVASLPFLSLSLARACIRVRYVRRGVRVQVCTTRDSSTSSTIRRVRRSTPPRFNIQTICNNFAATITSFLLPVPLSYLPPDFAALLLSPSFSLSLASSLSCSRSFHPSPTTIFSFAVSIVYSFPFIPPNSPVSFPFLSCPTVFLPPHEETLARTNTPTPRLREIALRCGALYLHLPPCDRNHSKSPRGH